MIDNDEFMSSGDPHYYTRHVNHQHHSDDDEHVPKETSPSSPSTVHLSTMKMNQHVKEYSTEEYKTLWKQFGDMHVTLEFKVIDSKLDNDDLKSELDNSLELAHIYTLASGVNGDVITFYNYGESLDGTTYLIEAQINASRIAKVRIKYSSNTDLSNFVNYFESTCGKYLKRIK